jgi:hypothetical protein
LPDVLQRKFKDILNDKEPEKESIRKQLDEYRKEIQERRERELSTSPLHLTQKRRDDRER